MKNLIVLLFLFLTRITFAQNMEIENAFPNLASFTHPMSVVGIDNRIVVPQEEGICYIFQNNYNVSSRKVFLDLTGTVALDQGGGLLAVAFHPNYASNRYIFVKYNLKINNIVNLRVSRFTVSATNPDSVLMNTELVEYTVQYDYPGHNGGNISFDDNGYLIDFLGDNSWDNDCLTNRGHFAQDLTTLYGKCIRINIDSASGGTNYSIPTDNPFYNNTQGYRKEIYAYGFRNPYQHTWNNGKLILADVGEDSWEEIDIIESGKNYGWNKMEGSHCFDCDSCVNGRCLPPYSCDTTGMNSVAPVYEYAHGINGSFSNAITGGYVYEGFLNPELRGRYIYADFFGYIWSLDGENFNNNVLLSDTNVWINSFGVDTHNELYFTNYSAGNILRFVATNPSGIGADVNDDGKENIFNLNNNYPNPFNPSTKIKYSVPKSSRVVINVFDILGNEIATLMDEEKPNGTYEITWNATNLPSGVYFYQLKAGEFMQTKKMILLK